MLEYARWKYVLVAAVLLLALLFVARRRSASRDDLGRPFPVRSGYPAADGYGLN